jgi:hypothetical protein
MHYPDVSFATGQRSERQNANAKKWVVRLNFLLVIGSERVTAKISGNKTAEAWFCKGELVLI